MSKNIKNNQIISIAGATATGKTQLALQLANYLIDQGQAEHVYLLSLDSRQVYQGLEVLTGADIPHHFQRQAAKQNYDYWQNAAGTISLHGTSIIPIWQDWSAAHCYRLYQSLSKQLSSKDYLILVGGTGFYQRQIHQPAASLLTKPNPQLRSRLEKYDLAKLQQILQKLDTNKWHSMNQSDRANPRRLIRAIELATLSQAKPNTQGQSATAQTNSTAQVSTIYLQLNASQRQQLIIKRVEQRFHDAMQEVKACLKQFELADNLPAASATGFQELVAYLKHQATKEQTLKQWQTREIQYAKRQDTWWKQESDLIKLDAAAPQLLQQTLATLKLL